MPLNIVRASKFRHVFGTAAKPDASYNNVKISKLPWESQMSSVNGKFLAVVLESQGGGAFMVMALNKPGRVDLNHPKVCGHKGIVMDVAFSPFNDNVIASCSEDCTVKVWEIPDGGLKENLDKPMVTLTGHQRKVGCVVWHPCAENILASASFDNTVLVWNVSTGESLLTLEHSDAIFSISWNNDGSLLATACKDKTFRIWDPRNESVCAEHKGHEGSKPTRIIFCGSKSVLFSTGFSRQSDRQYAVWEFKEGNLKQLKTENIDTSSGVLLPVYDEGTGMVYIPGKGDTSIRYFEMSAEDPYCSFLSMFQSNDPSRSGCFMPKKELDATKCEVMRYYKLLTKGNVVPISFTVPRKSDMFQKDIYPPCYAGVCALSAEEWAGGMNKPPVLLEYNDDGSLGSCVKGEATGSSKVGSGKAASSPSLRAGAPAHKTDQKHEALLAANEELKAENESLKKRVAELESRVSSRKF